MTAPTQAQIEAAKKAYWEAFDKSDDPNVMIEAALTAAAQVGEPPKGATHIGLSREAQIDAEWERRANEAAAIERCAQVADSFRSDNPYPTLNDAIAAAIRELKSVVDPNVIYPGSPDAPGPFPEEDQ